MIFSRPFFITILGSMIGDCVLADSLRDENQFVFNFASYLEQLQEPDLRETCTTRVDTIRLIANPAFSSAWSVRVEQNSSQVIVHISDGNSAAEPRLSSRTIDESSWSGLKEILLSNEFDQLPDSSDTWIPDDTIATIETCLDGQYDAVQRQFWHTETKEIVSRISSFRPSE